MTGNEPTDAPIVAAGDTSLIVQRSRLDLAIAGWLDAKQGKSQSQRTHKAYETTLASFRAALVAVGLDLDASPEHARQIALVAQRWAGQKDDGSEVAPATFNQRLAIVSSFFQYAARLGLIPDGNPIASYVERRSVQAFRNAQPLDRDAVQKALAAIDRTTSAGLRDYALLNVYLLTGRRLSEIVALRWRDVAIHGNRITLTFARTKGDKSIRDTLGSKTSAALLAWLHSHYGARLGNLAPDAPLWVVLAPRNRGGALSAQAIADICQKRLGVSKVHALRHTFAHTMEQAGATASEIQRRLGHSNLSTTGIYLAQLRNNENPYSDELESLFGVE